MLIIKYFYYIGGAGMRYVSDIGNIVGDPLSVGEVGSSVIKVFDTDTLETSIWRPDDGSGCVIGVSSSTKLAVWHSYKSAKLHDFIKSVKTISSNSEYKRNEAIVLEGLDIWVSLYGFKGSVAKFMAIGDSYVKVYSFYDLLCDLCKRYGLSLMSRKYLVLSFQCKTLVEFEHTPEAECFFTKMYLDALGRC